MIDTKIEVISDSRSPATVEVLTHIGNLVQQMEHPKKVYLRKVQVTGGLHAIPKPSGISYPFIEADLEKQILFVHHGNIRQHVFEKDIPLDTALNLFLRAGIDNLSLLPK